MQYLDVISKTTELLCSSPRQTIQYHNNPNYAPTSNAEEAEVEQFYNDLQDFLELTPKKDVLFIIGDWNTKSRKSRDTIPGVTGKFGLTVQNEAGQRLSIFPTDTTGHSKYPLPRTQEKTLHMDIIGWSTPKSD